MFLSINRASVPFGIWASALPVRASTASRANVNLNILFIELPGEATARLSTSPSFVGEGDPFVKRRDFRFGSSLSERDVRTASALPRRTDIENVSITSGKCQELTQALQ